MNRNAVRVTLDLPPKELSPNGRTHWARKARAVRQYRMKAWAAARTETNAYRWEWERAELRAVWFLPDRRRRDPDNLMSSLKAAIDGLTDAHVLADDRGLVIHPPVMMVDRQHPRVELTISPISAVPPERR